MNRKQFFKRAATAAAVIAVSPSALEAISREPVAGFDGTVPESMVNKSYVSVMGLLDRGRGPNPYSDDLTFSELFKAGRAFRVGDGFTMEGKQYQVTMIDRLNPKEEHLYARALNWEYATGNDLHLTWCNDVSYQKSEVNNG